jgi:hypothetical protein
MKSVDRDFDPAGTSKIWWPVAFIAVLLVYSRIVERYWPAIRLHELSFQMFIVPLLCVFPLAFSLLFRRYIKAALRENLVSARVAGNCEFFVAMMLFISYFAIFEFGWPH